MQVILPANGDIAKIWGSGKAEPTTYRLLAYTISAKVEGGTLLHNAVTGELVLLDAQEAKLLGALPCAYEPWMESLISKRFLVQESHNDQGTVDTLRRAWRIGNNPREITHYTILPTTGCNARCFYCYEAGCAHETMSDGTADQLTDFIDAHHGTKSVHITWFGGEPLVGIRQIDRICQALKARGVEFSSSMMSNGYLFDEEAVKRAKMIWNLKRVQITLDGTERVYNETKAYVNPCESPYRRVLSNIDLLLSSGIRVIVRMNLGPHNADDLNVLTNELAERFQGREGLSAYPHTLYDGCGFEPEHFAEDEFEALLDRQEMLEARQRSLSLSSAEGKLPRLKRYCCTSDDPHALMALPTGALGKCEHYIDRFPVGSVEDGITDPEEIERYRERIDYPQCALCPLYPSCIKLVRCRPDRGCSDALVRLKVRSAERAMAHAYAEFLCGKAKEMEPDEMQNC